MRTLNDTQFDAADLRTMPHAFLFDVILLNNYGEWLQKNRSIIFQFSCASVFSAERGASSCVVRQRNVGQQKIDFDFWLAVWTSNVHANDAHWACFCWRKSGSDLRAQTERRHKQMANYVVECMKVAAHLIFFMFDLPIPWCNIVDANISASDSICLPSHGAHLMFGQQSIRIFVQFIRTKECAKSLSRWDNITIATATITGKNVYIIEW